MSDAADPCTVADALARAAGRLRQAGHGEARREARTLLAFAMGRDPAYLFAHPEAELPDAAAYTALVERRAAGVPIQHLTGRQEFFGREFRVSPAALIPRPETEGVVEAALAVMPSGAALDVVDVGTGSGCIAVTLALERPLARLRAIDISAPALALARENAARLGATVDFLAGDLLAPLPPAPALDLVVSNPPYVAAAEFEELADEVREHEPRLALLAGAEGTEIYARLIPQAAARLRPGGWLVLELGYRSADAVRRMLPDRDWTAVDIRPDLAGWDRVLRAQRDA